ncbi:MAG TPA: dihydroneopterin aldolase [Candidatus Didemnitutus sp.]|nr:dihydroneopterin aldolase [Candidatus Didemnitutus sp.]
MKGKIHLKNMAFYGYHGALAEENALGQRFQVDLTLTLDIAEAARTDRLENTADYVEIYALCRKVLEQDRVKLIETLASHLLDQVLSANPRIDEATVVIRKPSVPLAGALDFVAIEASKKRA